MGSKFSDLSRRSVLMAGIGALAACSPGTRGQKPESISLLMSQFITTLDAASSFLQANQLPADLCYERLIRYKVEGGRIIGLVGELAQSWMIAPDRRSIRFVLNPGHRFDDGTEVTAKAVDYSFARIRAAKLVSASGLFWFDRIEVLDDYSFDMKLRLFAPYILSIFAAPGLGIVNPAVIAKQSGTDMGTRWLAANSCGSGAFRVKRFVRREEVILEPNPYAKFPSQYFTDIHLRCSSEETTRMISIRKGDADIVEAVSPNFHTWLEDQPNVRVQSGPTSSVLFLTPNNERPPFGDPRVRQAISMAINRPEIIQNILRGRARLLHGSLPDDILGCDLSIPFPTYDPEGARSLLSAAGVKKGHPITFTRVADNASPSATALAIQSYLRAVDLDVEIRQINAAARSKILAGDFDLTMQSVTLDFPDPWIMMNFAYGARAIGATNMSRYSNPEMEAVIAKADELDGEERAALYRGAQNMVHADLPTIPLFQDEWSFAVRSDIGGINYNFSQPMYFNFKDMKRQSV